MSTIINVRRYWSFDIELIRYRNETKTFETVPVLIVWRIETFTEEVLSLLIKYKETKCLFFWDNHKAKQTKVQFRNYRRSNWNENVWNCRSDRNKNINVCKGNFFWINKNKTKCLFFWVQKKEKNWNVDICSLPYIRIAHLQFHFREG